MLKSDSEVWTLLKCHEHHIVANEIIFLRKSTVTAN